MKVLTSCVLMLLGLSLWTRGDDSPVVTGDASEPPAPEGLRVMTLNTGHGRGGGRHHLLQTASERAANLERIARVAEREEIDLLALQEIGAEAEQVLAGSSLTTLVRGRHMAGFGTDYGTALLTHRPIADTDTVVFAASPPTLPKGFTRITLPWPASPTGSLDVVSVHLDFANPWVRRRQLAVLAANLESRPHPRVVLGDLNMGWGTTLRDFCDRLALVPHEPHAPLTTFDLLGTRIDWILVSETLRLEDHRILESGLSDHRAVVATVVRR